MLNLNSFSLKNPIKSVSTFDDKDPSSNKTRPELHDRGTQQISSARQGKLKDTDHLINLSQDDEKDQTRKFSEVDLGKIERQETDEDEYDDQDQLDTERIDVKKDIALVDQMIEPIPSDSQQTKQKSDIEVQGIDREAKQEIFQSSRRSIIKPPVAEYIHQSLQHQDVDPALEFHSDVESPGSTNRPVDPATSEANRQTGLALTTDVDQAKDDERDNFSLNDEEDGEEYDEFGEDEDSDHTSMHHEDDGEERHLVDKQRSGDGDGDQMAIFNSFGQSHRKSNHTTTQSDVFNSDDQEQQRLIIAAQNQRSRSKYRAISRGDANNQLSPKSRSNNQRVNFENQAANWAQAQTSYNNKALQQTINTKKGDYARIVTNPKYKFFDEETCGSAYFNDCNASERELDVRDTLKRVQIRYLNQRRGPGDGQPDKRKKIQILKKISVTDEQSPQESLPLKKKERKKKPADVQGANGSLQEGESQSITSDDIEEEDEIEGGGMASDVAAASGAQEGAAGVAEEYEDIGQESTQVEQTQGQVSTQQNIEEMDLSSVSSSSNQARVFQNLKSAIDEKYVPLQIRNLQKVANLVWLGVILLALTYFIIQSTLFKDIQSFIQIITFSEERFDDIMTINMNLYDIASINEGVLDVRNIPKVNLTKREVIDSYIKEFLSSSTSLQDFQTQLSQRTASLPLSSRRRINPESVSLSYYSSGENTSQHTFNIWEAIVQIQVFSYDLSERPGQITHSNEQFLFITQNCMNSVLSALRESTQAIIEQSDSARTSNIQVFLILLLSVSGALILSLVFLLPVVRKAKMNRQEVFELYTLKKVEKHIEEQLKKCRWFIAKYQQQSDTQQEYDDHNENHFGGNAQAAIEENSHIPGEGMKGRGEDKKDDYISKVKKSKKKKKPLDSNFLSLSLRFLIFALVIETYFLYTYLISKSFLEKVSSMTRELRLLISRQPQLAYLMVMEKEFIVSNMTQSFMYRPLRNVIEESLDQQNLDYQELLSLFHQNFNSHTELYKSEFNKVMYLDACTGFLSCPIDQSDLMQKGLYAKVISYWQDLTNIHYDFIGSNKTQQRFGMFLNSPLLLSNQQMLEDLFRIKHKSLVEVLKSDIETAFSQEQISNQTVFAFFILYVLALYLLVWRQFMRGLLADLWRAKTCLTLLPVEMCYKIEEIRGFIYRNSSQSNLGSDRGGS